MSQQAPLSEAELSRLIAIAKGLREIDKGHDDSGVYLSPRIEVKHAGGYRIGWFTCEDFDEYLFVPDYSEDRP